MTLSPAQERLWFLHRLDPDDLTYNLTLVRRLRGPLDADALVAAFTEVATRHESLRTRFPDSGGRPYAVVDPPGPVPVERLDAADEDAAHRLVQARIRAPFDLAAAPPLRVTLIRLAADHHVLCVVPHHIIADGWSLNVLLDDLAKAYAGLSLEPLPEAPPREESDDVGYWTDRLAGAAALELPADRARPARRGGDADEVVFRVPADPLVKLARQERCTLFMVLLAAFQTLLARHSGQDDVVVGSPDAGRAEPELEPLIGLFASTLVLRGDLSGDPSFTELLRRTRRRVSEAMGHRDVPVERILAALDIDRDLSRTPLFQTMFTLHSAAVGYAESARFADLTSEAYPHDCRFAMGDLTLDVWPRADGLLGAFVYGTDLFDRATVERFAERFETLLTSIVATPETKLSALPMLPPNERELLVTGWNDTAAELPDATVVDLVRARVSNGVTCGDVTLTHAGLIAHAERIAERLPAGPGDVVAVRLDRSAELPACLLGVLMTGAAYLPIDPELPPGRIDYLLTDSGARFLLTDDGVRELDGRALVPGAAYVLYTSGSTGRPKGVAVPHSALTNLLLAMAGLLDAGPDDVWLGHTALSFDISALELYLPLVTGGRLVVADSATAADGAALARLIDDAGVTHVQATPSGWSMLLTAGVRATRLMALAGGEALPLPLARELRGRTRRLLNVYGPTETTIWSTAWEVPPDPSRVSIGTPIANTTAYVHGPDGLAPVGVPGELLIGGAGVAIGYPGRPELTAERFVPDPYGASGASGETPQRTDEASGGTRPQGARLYRTGDRVRRLADGTLEFLGRWDGQIKLRGHRIELGEIEAVLAEQVTQVAVVLRDDAIIAYVVGTVDLDKLRAALPAYMVPARVITLDALPLTPNGKVDRAALCEMAMSPEPVAEIEYAPPRTRRERRVAEIFAEVLGLPEVGVDGDFFALGGHSLLATRVIARLDNAVPVRELFTHPTVAAFAAVLDSAEDAHHAGPRPLHRTNPPLSPAQERLWFLWRLYPDDASYNMFIVRRLRGPLDTEAFGEAVNDLAARHETLRTRFPEVDGRPAAVVEPPGPMTVEYLTGDATDLVAERTNRPLDLSAAPPVRVTLIRTADDEHALCVVLHHIIADGWSLTTLLNDLSALYEARLAWRPADLPPLAVQYGDIAQWQRERADPDALEYWREQLADPPTLELPADRPRRPGPARGAHHTVEVSGEVAAGLERAGRRNRATLFMVILAAYQVLLARHTGQRDVLVGTVTAGRDRVELEPVVGYLTKTLALRGDLSGDPAFAELLSRTRTTFLDALTHQDVPFEELLARLGIERDLTRTPLFQTMAILHSQVTDTARTLGDVAMLPFPDGWRQVKFDLTLDAVREDDRLVLMFGYDANLFDADTVAALAERFTTLLAGIAADPDVRLSALPLLTPADRRLVVGGGDPDTTPVPERVAEAIAKYAAEPAVICGDETITYAELGERIARAMPPADGVVTQRRSIDDIVNLLAVWRSGRAYIPRDPADPRPPPGPAEGAYVIRTSGSTGEPKNVVVEHAGLAARVGWMREAYGLGPGDRVVQLASLSFDTHAEEIFPALTAGAAVVLMPDGPAALPELLAARPDITVLDLPTAYFHRLTAMIDEVAWPAALRLVIIGGEQAHAEAAARWRGRARLVNTYGPTETTIVATAADLTTAGAGRPPIGTPITGTTARVLDEYGSPVPPGTPGELVLGGAGVARGYGPEHRTGDRVRLRHDGQFEFLGRLDDQLKVRGFRVEPGEIEARLAAHPAVRQVAVTARDDTLVAFVIGSATNEELAAHATRGLPPYLVPTRWVTLNELPLTTSGKVDRAALRVPDERETAFVPPRTEAEELVAEVWAEVLGLDRVGASDDFFALGGHSLLAVQVAARLRAVVDVPIRTLFARRTVADLADAIEELLAAELADLSDEEALRLLDEESR